MQVQDDDDVDDPDLAMRLAAEQGLREHTGGEITTVVAHGADANIYKSAAAFEDIITDPNLLRVSIGLIIVLQLTAICGSSSDEGRGEDGELHLFSYI